MDPFYNKTVTVYNKTTADGVMGGDIWHAYVLENVRLLVSKGTNVSKTGLETADSAKLYVDLPRPYLAPIEWQNEADKAEYFTFQEQSGFFVEGDTTKEDTTKDDFFQYMKDKYDNCFMVSTVDKFDLIPHLEVGGK